MRWLWWIGPIAVAVVYVVTALWPTRRARRRRLALHRWLDDYLGPLEHKQPRGKQGRERSRLVGRLPERFEAMVDKAGGGAAVGQVVLVPKLAYLAMCAADRQVGSDHQTVVVKLARSAPAMVVRPLPVVDGGRVENTGIAIDKDPEFMDRFVVEAGDEQVSAKAIVRWLKSPLREALMETPAVWLRTQGRFMAISLYGGVDVEKLDELVATADAITAERGAQGGPSLFGDEEAAEATAAEAKRRRRARAKAAQAEPPRADRGLRIRAAAVDWALYLLAAAVLYAVLRLGGTGLRDLWTVTEFAHGDGPWQGGWTTKGFGALVVAEALLVGLFAYQTYLAARQGRSIGKLVFGAKVVRLNGEPVHFLRGVLLRTWLVAAVPLVLALVLARPLAVQPFLANLTRPWLLGVAAALVLLDVALLLVGEGRCGHDIVAGTKVVRADKLADKLR